MNRKRTNWLVIHCSATRAVMDVGAADIRRWHRAQGWTDIGYHYVIRRSGKVEAGRPLQSIGTHVKGHNTDSVGICLAGGLNNETFKPENNYTPQQWEALTRLLKTLLVKYPKAKVRGHRDFPNVQKACPCFSVIPWAKKNGFPT
jgi:N-acetylmuramoyl-L-alanine amidase